LVVAYLLIVPMTPRRRPSAILGFKNKRSNRRVCKICDFRPIPRYNPQVLSSSWDGRPFGHNRHVLCPFRRRSWVPI